MKKSGTLVEKLKKPFGLSAILLTVLSIFLIWTVKKSQSQWQKTISQSKYKELLPYLVAQAKTETANFTSSAYKDLNNLYGMGCAKRRSFDRQYCSTKTYDGGRHLSGYRDASQSANDMLLWLDYSSAPTSFNSLWDYVVFLDNKDYFEVSRNEYYNALKSWMN